MTTFATTRAVAITDATDLEALAARLGISGLDPDDPRTLRPLWGNVLSRLAEARPSVVAIDIGFLENRREDTELVRGIEDLRDAGCPVVAALPDWSGADQEDPLLDRDVATRCLMGGVTGTYEPGRPWRADLAVEQPGESEASPSLPLAVLATRGRAGQSFAFEIMPRSSRVLIRPRNADKSAAPPLEVRATAVRADAGGGVGGIRRGATVAHLEFAVPADHAFAPAIIDPAQLFTMSESALFDAFHRRVVILANARAGLDSKLAPDGRVLSGYQAVMAAIETLIANRSYESATNEDDAAAAGIGAMAGIFGAGAAFARRRRRVILIASAAAATMLLCLGVFALERYFVNPVPVVVSTVLACELGAAAAGVRRARTPGANVREGGSR
jgi:MYXO-CTERM domain-containing protein